ncbi:hydrolase [Bacillus sp. FJAT-18017]|uniref:carbon-nitrogen family hydrolase n=1 Tax=Bacillus sp. FJAT-18017 TaxID=1705566 RepID=UPI0006AE476D|nr:carbon-nitrogen family hydrolase [Bacillus sp. FJAT-18017]ALC91611.1 hydrolase [Bacillus sp. FJAT-18017]
MKIACVQMNIQFGDVERNYASVENYIKKAAADKADIIVFPEMWNTGYALNQLDQLADENGQRTQNLLSELASKFNVNIVGGSVATKRDGSFYNTMYVANRSGEVVADYDKAHLFKLMDEHHFLNAGQKMNTFELDGIMCGGVICYDIRFPEWILAHVLKGAKIMFVPAEWPATRIDHWQILLQARAIENQCFIVAVNRVGSDPNNQFNGHSMVIAPWGELLLSRQTEEGIYTVDLDLKEVDRVRNAIPVFQDRRADLYANK